MAKKKLQKGNGRKNRKAIVTGILALFGLAIICSGIFGYKYYRLIYKVNIDLRGKESAYLFIPTGTDYEGVKKILYSDSLIIDMPSFEWLAEKKGYAGNVKAGRYLIKDRMTNNALINLLRSGRQEPIKVTFNNIRTKDELASRIAKLIEADSASLMSLMNDNDFLEKYGLNKDNVMCTFIPNTYELYWNTTAESFIDKMNREYLKFWNEDRKKKAETMGFTPEQTVILASIVYQETKKTDEMSKIAGVYVNRINKGIPLQADPTVIFALGDFTIKRVLKWQTQIDSPYNTYVIRGLPPGPICLPDPIVVESVLQYEHHDYIFFCAKEDFSGYHAFAKTGAQHEQNANRYRAALDKRKIKK